MSQFSHFDVQFIRPFGAARRFFVSICRCQILDFSRFPTAYSGSIVNNGIINTGKGDDIIDGITGGFGGYGVMNLGDGNDTLKGFGTGTFNGGAGDSDKILLGDGDYTITMEGEVTTITSNGVAMITTGFESISGNVGGPEIMMGQLMSNSPPNAWFIVVDGLLTLDHAVVA